MNTTKNETSADKTRISPITGQPIAVCAHRGCQSAVYMAGVKCARHN